MNLEIKSAILRVLPFLGILIVLIVAVKRKKLDAQSIHLNKPDSINHFLIWTLGFLIFVLITEFTLNAFNLLETGGWNHPFISSLIRICGAVVLAPIVEEFIFRGLLLNALMNRKLNMHLAIFIQATIFVLLHNFTYEFSFSSNIGIIQSLLDATLFGYARLYTKSLYTPITMHMSGNLVATLERLI